MITRVCLLTTISLSVDTSLRPTTITLSIAADYPWLGRCHL